MRLAILLMGTSVLAACGGGGETSIGSVGNIPPAIPSANTNDHTFVAPTKDQTYQSNGASHTFDYKVVVDNLANTSSGQQEQLYAGNSTTVRQSGLSIAYSPRDAIFNITLSDPLSRLSVVSRFQDPVHRTNFGGALEPQAGTPNLTLAGLQYLEAASINSANAGFGMAGNTLRLNLPAGETSASFNQDTFFYQKPGTTTKYVTFAGFLRNSLTAVRVDTPAVDATPTTAAVAATSKTTYTNKLARGASVFGELTLNSNVPKSGSGTYTGAMLATAVINDQLDNDASAPSYFQWIEGSSTTNVNFGSNTFSLVLNGNVLAPQLDGVTDGGHTVRSGARFNAEGRGNIDLVTAGGFLGQFQRVWFVNPDNSRIDLLIAGSSIDGAFYGPVAQEVGGSYRIVGGTPDQRIDILGIFTGKQ
jgi:hypothetical protein